MSVNYFTYNSTNLSYKSFKFPTLFIVEGELVEGDHDHDEEEETEEEIEDTSYVQQTYNDLKAAYSQLTPEESDVEQTEEDNPKVL